MRKQHLTNAINTILETNEDVTIRVKDNSYLFLERAGQLVFDSLHKEGYKICTYNGQVQVLEELGADLPKDKEITAEGFLKTLSANHFIYEEYPGQYEYTEGQLKAFAEEYLMYRTKCFPIKKYTIKDLKKGKVGIEYKGDLDRLNKVLKKCFPNDSEAKGNLKYYYSGIRYAKYWSSSNFRVSFIKVWVSENDIEL